MHTRDDAWHKPPTPRAKLPLLRPNAVGLNKTLRTGGVTSSKPQPKCCTTAAWPVRTLWLSASLIRCTDWWWSTATSRCCVPPSSGATRVPSPWARKHSMPWAKTIAWNICSTRRATSPQPNWHGSSATSLKCMSASTSSCCPATTSPCDLVARQSPPPRDCPRASCGTLRTTACHNPCSTTTASTPAWWQQSSPPLGCKASSVPKRQPRRDWPKAHPSPTVQVTSPTTPCRSMCSTRAR